MAKLLFRLTPGESLDFPLDAGVTRLGRGPGNEIVINNTWISSRHAEFHRAGGDISVHDLGSSNGTSVNGELIQQHILRDGDRLAFGQLEAIYSAWEAADHAVPARSPGTNQTPSAAPVAVPASSPVTIARNMAGKAQDAELEAVRKTLTEAGAASARAAQAQAEAEAVLASTRLAIKAAEIDLHRIRGEAEAIRSAAAEEARGAVTARETARQAAVSLQNEIQSLTKQSVELRSALAVQDAAAREQSLEVANALIIQRHESGELQTALTHSRGQLAELQASLTHGLAELQRQQLETASVEVALLAVRTAWQEGETVAAAARAAHQEILADSVCERTVAEELKSGNEALRAVACQLKAENSGLIERTATARDDLAALEKRITEVRNLALVEELKISQRVEAVEKLEFQHNTLASKVSQWEQREAAIALGEAAWVKGEATSIRQRQEAAASEAARDAAQAALNAALDCQTALASEAAALEARLNHLRRETEGAEALNSKVTDLRQQQAEAERRLEYLDDRLAGMSQAPDPNWGTVHTLARSFIKKLDLLDDLISHLTSQPEAAGPLGQLLIFRAGLLDILKEYSIEAYSLEPGTVIDVAARKRIQIVETLSEGSHDGTRIVRTYRPGYVCLNGDLGIPTLLRKADVAVSISLSEGGNLEGITIAFPRRSLSL